VYSPDLSRPFASQQIFVHEWRLLSFYAMNPSSMSKLLLFAGAMIVDACSTPDMLASIAASCISETELQ